MDGRSYVEKDGMVYLVGRDDRHLGVPVCIMGEDLAVAYTPSDENGDEFILKHGAGDRLEEWLDAKLRNSPGDTLTGSLEVYRFRSSAESLSILNRHIACQGDVAGLRRSIGQVENTIELICVRRGP